MSLINMAIILSIAPLVFGGHWYEEHHGTDTPYTIQTSWYGHTIYNTNIMVRTHHIQYKHHGTDTPYTIQTSWYGHTIYNTNIMVRTHHIQYKHHGTDTPYTIQTSWYGHKYKYSGHSDSECQKSCMYIL